MRFKAVLLVGRAITYMGPRQNEGWTLRLRASRVQRRIDRREIVAVRDRLDVPAIGLKAARAILGKCDVGSSRQRHTVVVIEVDQLAELQMARERRGLRRDALHQVTVTDDPVGEMVDDLEAGAIVRGSQMRLGYRQTHAVAEALAQRPRRRLDARRNTTLRMAWRHAAPFAKLFDLS